MVFRSLALRMNTKNKYFSLNLFKDFSILVGNGIMKSSLRVNTEDLYEFYGFIIWLFFSGNRFSTGSIFLQLSSYFLGICRSVESAPRIFDHSGMI